MADGAQTLRRWCIMLCSRGQLTWCPACQEGAAGSAVQNSTQPACCRQPMPGDARWPKAAGQVEGRPVAVGAGGTPPLGPAEQQLQVPGLLLSCCLLAQQCFMHTAPAGCCRPGSQLSMQRHSSWHCQRISAHKSRRGSHQVLGADLWGWWHAVSVARGLPAAVGRLSLLLRLASMLHSMGSAGV